METIKRNLVGLFASGSKKNILLATHDDTFGVTEGQLDEIVQAFLGNRQDIRSADAIDSIPGRLRDAWTWPVVSKVLLVLHYTATAPQTSIQWLQGLFQDPSIFNSCKSFREGENTDLQAETHAVLIRQYAQFLQVFIWELMKETSPLSKIRYMHYIGTCTSLRVPSSQIYRTDEDDELFRKLQKMGDVLDSNIRVLTNDKEEVLKIVGFCDLTQCLFNRVFKEALRLFSLYNAAILELIERLDRLTLIEELQDAILVWNQSCSFIDKLNLIGDFIATLPSAASAVVRLEQPSNHVLKTLEKRKRRLQKSEHKPNDENHGDRPQESNLKQSRDTTSSSSTKKTKSRHKHKRKHHRKRYSSSSSYASQSSAQSRARTGNRSRKRGSRSDRRESAPEVDLL